MARRITVANQKGGVGKTTTAVNLSTALALQGHRVLLVDLDPQANATEWVLGRDGGRGLYEWFASGGEQPIADLLTETQVDGLDMIPGTQFLVGIDKALRDVIGPELLIREALDSYEVNERYGYVLFDTGPALGVLLVNALAASHAVVIPVAAHVMSLAGLSQLMNTVGAVTTRLNPQLQEVRVLACRVDARTNHSKDVQAAIKKRFGRNVFATYIRENVRLAEAFSEARPIFDAAPSSTGAEDYYALAEELAKDKKLAPTK